MTLKILLTVEVEDADDRTTQEVFDAWYNMLSNRASSVLLGEGKDPIGYVRCFSAEVST